MVLWSHSASGATARDALVEVFTYNPVIAGERAGTSAVEIEMDIAKADRRFDFRLGGSAAQYVTEDGFGRKTGLTATVSATASLPIWSGGRISAKISGALARAQAARADLSHRTNLVLSDAATAYLDVARDRALLKIQQEQVRILGENLKAATARFAAKDLTQTDVEQAKVRLAMSEASVSRAEASLVTSSQRYWTITGSMPDGSESMDDALPDLPDGVEVRTLLTSAPALVAEAYRVKAAMSDLRLARAMGRPRISLFARYERQIGQREFAVATGRANASVGINFSLPLYQGGRAGAEVRARQADLSFSMERKTETERSLLAEVRSRYAGLMAADAAVKESRVALQASQNALRYVEEQNLHGDRTFLDTLNASREVLNAQTRLISTRRDRIAIAYEMLALFGRLEPIVSGWHDNAPAVAAKAIRPSVGRVSTDNLGLWQVRGLERWRLKAQSI